MMQMKGRMKVVPQVPLFGESETHGVNPNETPSTADDVAGGVFTSQGQWTESTLLGYVTSPFG